MAQRNAPSVFVDELTESSPPGSFRWTRRHGDPEGTKTGLNFKCPCGCGRVYGAEWGPGKGWEWDGNIEKPTVKPSLGCHGSPVSSDGYHWHGFLTAGVFEEC